MDMEQNPPTDPTTSPRQISASRKLVAWTVLIAAIAGTVAFKYNEQTLPALLTGPMVQLPAPDRVTILWTANAPFEQATVEVRASGETVADIHKVRPENGRYQLELDHLPPDTAYQYTIQIRGLLSRDALTSGPHTFRTPPSRNANIRFLAFGDSGVGSNTQAMLADRMVGGIVCSGDARPFQNRDQTSSLAPQVKAKSAISDEFHHKKTPESHHRHPGVRIPLDLLQARV